MSSRAGASKTTQIEPPLRKTAAPAGLAKGKLRTTCPCSSSTSALTTPLLGRGSGRVAGLAGGSVGCGGAVSDDAATSGRGKTLIQTPPSAVPVLRSASSARVMINWVRPPDWPTLAASIHLRGPERNRERSGRTPAGKVTVRVSPSRRVETPEAKSSRVKPAASATLTSWRAPAFWAPIGVATAAAIATAATPELRDRRKDMDQAGPAGAAGAAARAGCGPAAGAGPAGGVVAPEAFAADRTGSNRFARASVSLFASSGGI